jgi:hypothetical protein
MSSLRPTQTEKSLTKGPQPEKPCSKCGERPRKIGLSWCQACISAKAREKKR